MSDPKHDWVKDAQILSAAGSRAVRASVPREKKTEETPLDFRPALRRILGAEPTENIQAQLTTVLKMLSGLQMDLLTQAIVHRAIAETYSEVLRDAAGPAFEWKPDPEPRPNKDGEAT